MKLRYEEIFTVLIRVMNISQLNPNTPKDKKWALYVIISHGLYTLESMLHIYNIIHHDLKNENFRQACKNGSLVTLYILITFARCIMILNQDLLVSLIRAMETDYESKSYIDKEIMCNYARQGTKFFKLTLIFLGGSASTLFIKNFADIIYFCMTDGCRLVHLYELSFPEPLEQYKNSILVYTVLYVLMLYYVVYGCSIYIAFVSLAPILMLHACGQFEIVRQNLNNLFQDSTENEVQEKLKDIVIRLQRTYKFVDGLKTCFREIMELTLKTTPLLLPISYYVVTESHRRGELGFESLSLIISGIMTSGSWCYFSDRLMDMAESTKLAVYSCGWESRYDRRARSTLALVMMRAQRPVALRSMFCNVCLDTLADVFRQSYAILNLLNAVWN